MGPAGNAGFNFWIFQEADVTKPFVVPNGVTKINVELVAGGGGGGVGSELYSAGSGGSGNYHRAVLAVTPGETLWTYVGGGGAGGYCSGLQKIGADHGGTTAIWRSDQVVIRAYGGGAGGFGGASAGPPGAGGGCLNQWPGANSYCTSRAGRWGGNHQVQVPGALAPGGIAPYGDGGDGGFSNLCHVGRPGIPGILMISW
jgi:general secretion pathway protein D